MADYNSNNFTNRDLEDISKFDDENPERIIIKAVGVGGGGNNAVDHMFRANIPFVSFANINTDAKALRQSPVPERLVIGDGLGAGNIPEKARDFAEEAADKIKALFNDDTQMVFITAGMGGGTGTGAAPVVARICSELGLLTIGIVTIPFLFEGKKKIVKAIRGADEMSKYVDALLVINNERLTEIYPDLDIINGFAKADDTLTTAARSISEMITCSGRICLDFNDVNTTLRQGGSAIISSGYGEGEHRVTKAIEDALRSPLLKNREIMGSKKLLFNIYFSPEAEDSFRMEEATELTDFVSSIGDDVDVIWGLAFDESLGEKVKITILAAGFDVTLEDEEKGLMDRGAGKGGATGFGFGGQLPRHGGGSDRSDRGARQDSRSQAKSASSSEPNPEEEKRLIDEYGQKAVGLNGGKDRSKYIILTADQIDDDAVIDTLEKTPTFNRDKKVVERLKNAIPSYRRPDPSDGADSRRGGSRINFVG